MALRKTLPKDFDAIVRSGDLGAMQRVFSRSALHAYDSPPGRRRSRSSPCPTSWWCGWSSRAPTSTSPNAYGETPLHHHAGSWRGNPTLILQLGADLRARDASGRTALFGAMMHPEHVRALLESGIEVDALDQDGETALDARLRRTRTDEITKVTESVQLLLAAGATIPEGIGEEVRALSEDFARIRDDYAPESVEETAAAVQELCRLFGVAPAGVLERHDGSSPIEIRSHSPAEQFSEPWDLLVPGIGPATTVQGEVVRIVGRVTAKIHGTGGANWDADFVRMLSALPALLAAHTAPTAGAAELVAAEVVAAELVAAEVAERARAMHGGEADDVELAQLRDLVVAWVAQHPTPIALPLQPYRR